MIIKVTKEHIAEGKKCDCDLCPVALAIKTVLKPAYTCVAGIAQIYIKRGGKCRYMVGTPHLAVSFMNGFDHGGLKEPFDFELEIPSDYLKEQCGYLR